MRISLTETQIRQLMPYFDKVRAAAQTGAPGMLVAQVKYSRSEERYWLEPGFLDHEHAKLITEKGQS
jgi:hypothetical protein